MTSSDRLISIVSFIHETKLSISLSFILQPDDLYLSFLIGLTSSSLHVVFTSNNHELFVNELFLVFQVYNWSGLNEFYVKGDLHSLGFGSGE